MGSGSSAGSRKSAENYMSVSNGSRVEENIESIEVCK